MLFSASVASYLYRSEGRWQVTATETVQVFTDVASGYGDLWIATFSIMVGLALVVFIVKLLTGAVKAGDRSW